MGLFRSTRTVPTTGLDGLPGLSPLRDDVFLYLLEQATRGDVPVFFGAAPRVVISPFDAAYDPSQHSVGEAAIREVIAAWQRGQFSHVWVYPKGGRYVLSDDYIIWSAAKRGAPEFLPCWILGEPIQPATKDVQGPIDPAEIPKLLGFR